MSDMYVYYFLGWDAAAGENVRSRRRATLEAIKGKGEPIMESQIVVDITELDPNGFVIQSDDGESNAISDLSSEIRSLMLRVEARERAAHTLTDGVNDARKYMLSLESRELHKRVRSLQAERDQLLKKQMGSSRPDDSPQFSSFQPA